MKKKIYNIIAVICNRISNLSQKSMYYFMCRAVEFHFKGKEDIHE